MFDLEKAIAEWRQQMLATGIKTDGALDELESDLRKEVERSMRSGMEASFAFKTAVIVQVQALLKECRDSNESKRAVLGIMKAGGFSSEQIPMLPMEDFASTAKEILELALEEARLFHCHFAGTEHLLLSLTKSKSGMVANVMRKLGVDGDAIRKEIETEVGSGPAQEAAREITFTPRAKKALQLAADESRAFKQPRINPEHILLGLILVGGSVAEVVLKRRGVDGEKARAEILREMGANPGIA